MGYRRIPDRLPLDGRQRTGQLIPFFPEGKTLTFTNDLSSNIGKVRLRIPDTDSVNQIFSDEELTEFLTANGNNVPVAAGRAVFTLASNQAYILKRVTNNGNSTDGPAVAAELRAYARELIEEGRTSDGSTTVQTGVAIVRNHRMLRGF